MSPSNAYVMFRMLRQLLLQQQNIWHKAVVLFSSYPLRVPYFPKTIWRRFLEKLIAS
jgi:hypothetical protein